MSTPLDRPHLSQLTSLRFFAAMAVVIHHLFTAQYIQPQNIPIQNILRGLGSSVAFFFILSGFILTYTYHISESSLSLRNFYVARIARLYPVYLVGLFLSVAHAYIVPGDTPHGVIVPFILDLGLIQAWFPSYSILLNGPGWSLSAEAFFYAIFPILISKQCTRTLYSHPLIVTMLAWAFGIIPGVFLIIYHLPHNIPLWTNCLYSFHPSFRLPEFIFGITLALQFIDGHRLKYGTQLAIISGLSILGFHAFSDASMLFLGHNTLLAPLFCLGIWGISSQNHGILHIILAWKPLVILGEASFSLYILHEPLRSICVYLWRLLHFPPKNTAFIVFYLLITIAASIASFFFFETPMRRYIRRHLERSK